MRIVCPACESTYEVPAATLAGHRRVRCAKCGADWEPEPGDAMVEAEPRPEFAFDFDTAPDLAGAGAPAEIAVGPPLVASAPRAMPMPPAKGNSALWAAWILSFALLGAMAAAGYAWRGAVMHGWPPSTRLYAALGLQR